MLHTAWYSFHHSNFALPKSPRSASEVADFLLTVRVRVATVFITKEIYPDYEILPKPSDSIGIIIFAYCHT